MVTKLGVGLVTQGEIQAKTACCLITAIPNTQVPVQMLLSESCYIHYNREEVVDMAIRFECSHLLFVDSDMFFPQDAIKKLIDADKDIVGGRYNKRVVPLQSTVKEDIKELSEVAFVPTGFLMINMEVFKKLQKPFFFFEKGDRNSSEDLWFCERAKEAGFKIWCDPTIQIGHLGIAMF